MRGGGLARELAERYRALCQSGLDPTDAERRVFDEVVGRSDIRLRESPGLYEDFLAASAPGLRRSHGVYYTPGAVVGAQLQLVDDLLRHRLECTRGFADPRVAVVDPAAGSGAYPLAILEHVGTDAAASLRQRMWLFEPMPGAAAIARAHGLPIQECDALSTCPRVESPIVVCIGNPPYRRRTTDAVTRSTLDGFLHGARGVHLKNLYNDYVYFWRWALRVAFEQHAGPAVVCLVTAASYVRGPAFVGVRESLRKLADELWVIDLEGDHLAARATDNVFPIRTPVAIALAVRFSDARRPEQPAGAHYTRVHGPRDAKLARLSSVRHLSDFEWRAASGGYGDSLAPAYRGDYLSWPLLTELFPWQISGAQLKRTWPIATTPDVLRARWQRLLELPAAERARAFGPTRDRDLESTPPDLRDESVRLPPLGDLTSDSPCLAPTRYAYRAFDRHWVLPDSRLGDFMRPRLWRSAGPRQMYLTSLLTNVLGPGPALVAAADVPDLDHFRGSFGARAVIPLWLDAAATQPNVDRGWLARLSEQYGFDVGAEALAAYCYALLSGRGYVRRFEDELRTPGPRVPLTRDAEVFGRAVHVGSELIAVHTHRSRHKGTARRVGAIGEGYPQGYGYDPAAEALAVGNGAFAPVRHDAWDYAVSGYRVIDGWLRHRVRKRGRSVLDQIAPETWAPSMSAELLELLWLLERTLALEPAQDALLDEVISSGGRG